MREKFIHKQLIDDELIRITGGGGNLGSAVGACVGGVLLFAATGPVTAGAVAVVCLASGISGAL